MAIRPDNHITGDNAVRQISAKLIPEEWTISRPESDYGLDMLIEVVDNNKTTGRFFFIQSKGTKDLSENGLIKYQMSVERIKDYSKVDLPVLFVYYSNTQKRFWGRWMNALYDTLSEKEKSQQTITMTFTDANEIDRDYLTNIGLQIDVTLTRCVSLQCSDSSIEHSHFNAHLASLSSTLLEGPVKIDDPLAVSEIHINYEGSLTEGSMFLESNEYNIKIPLSISQKDFLYYRKLRDYDCPQELLNSVFVIAMLSRKVVTSAPKYLLQNVNDGNFGIVPTDCWRDFIMDLPLQNENLENLNKLFDCSIVNGIELSQYIVFALFISSTKDNDKTLYESFLNRYLETVNDNETKGHMYYNLANRLRCYDLAVALQHYKVSSKFFPVYKDQCYWNQEVAGCCYLVGRYYFAELFYKKAKRLNVECCENIDILISDCLVSQGKYEEAQKFENMYVDKIKNMSASLLLKMKVTERLKDNNIHIRHSNAFYNSALSAAEYNNHQDAMWNFLISWRLNDSDLEALCDAFISAYNMSDDIYQTLIIASIKEINPEEGYRYIVKCFVSQMDGNLLNETATVLSKLLFD
ncbi:MAG: DUF4365 domain-containing protein [Bacteroidales bacterium]|nr:DUF4365 domain-containing protein [Bacteroidales bacterium]